MMSLLNKPAPGFELPDVDGVEHRPVDYRGRWLLLVFHRHLG
ncbi:redoxin domain-containing protein [Fuerstiella marisgermanici]|nr:redoxin domain-containing protein [Fuerstiella marisgermanici]